MEANIRLAKKEQTHDCLLCVQQSDLWNAYFKNNPSHESALEEMISKKQVYVVTDKHDECIGFMGVINNGCFHKFSYLSALAVKNRYRNRGIGKGYQDGRVVIIGKMVEQLNFLAPVGEIPDPHPPQGQTARGQSGRPDRDIGCLTGFIQEEKCLSLVRLGGGGVCRQR